MENAMQWVQDNNGTWHQVKFIGPRRRAITKCKVMLVIAADDEPGEPRCQACVSVSEDGAPK